jgi:hypothetical protein
MRRPLLLLSLLAACQTTAVPAHPLSRDEVVAVLTAQTERWNAGDLAGFVATYWDGPDLSFLGSRGLTRGRADLLAMYQKSYPTAEARGVLSLDVLDFWPLGGDHALLLGKYHLAGAHPGEGFFSLVLARQHGRVVILHDHTSAASK